MLAVVAVTARGGEGQVCRPRRVEVGQHGLGRLPNDSPVSGPVGKNCDCSVFVGG